MQSTPPKTTLEELQIFIELVAEIMVINNAPDIGWALDKLLAARDQLLRQKGADADAIVRARKILLESGKPIPTPLSTKRPCNVPSRSSSIRESCTCRKTHRTRGSKPS